jgi:hypothetical protein
MRRRGHSAKLGVIDDGGRKTQLDMVDRPSCITTAKVAPRARIKIYRDREHEATLMSKQLSQHHMEKINVSGR